MNEKKGMLTKVSVTLLIWMVLVSGGFIFMLIDTRSKPSAQPSSPLSVEGKTSFAKLARTASPSVVNISTIKVIEGGGLQVMPFGRGFGEDHPFREFFERFFRDRMPKKFKKRELGTGFFIDRGGLIMTNNHVVADAKTIEVRLSDDRTLEAKIVGRDPKTDLALIRIDSQDGFVPLPLGNSDTLAVGDWVLAIGSPFGLGHTVTAGIVSAKYRRIGAGAYDDFIQTDASINPGNSGGPLINTKGEVVGINSAIFSPSGGNIGIGFAIPVNMAKDLLPQLKKGRVIRGWLGVMIQDITPELKEKLGLKEERGALVSDVVKGGAADRAGIRRGDVIVTFDGKGIDDMHEFPYLVASTPVGKVVPITIVRKGVLKETRVEIGEFREEQAAEEALGRERPGLGLTVKEITPELARHLNLNQTEGLAVTEVEANSPARKAGLRPGDIILEVDQSPVDDLESFYRQISKHSKGDLVLFLVKRRGTSRYVTLKIGS
jgi:serine protease Do